MKKLQGEQTVFGGTCSAFTDLYLPKCCLLDVFYCRRGIMQSRDRASSWADDVVVDRLCVS